MSAAKIAITLDRRLLSRLDRMVKQRGIPSRSRAIQEALRDVLDRADRSRLARACAKLDPKEEQQMAEEGMAWEIEQWPEY